MNDLDPTDRRLADLRTAMTDHLDALLDADAGLRDVLIEARHTGLNGDLDNTLDVAAGLRAIVPTAEHRVPVERAGPATAAPRQDDPADASPIEGAVASFLMSLDTPTLLAIRRDRALDALAAVFFLVPASARSGDLVRTLDHDLGADSAPGRALNRALALELAIEPAYGLAFDLDLDHGRLHAFDLNRVRDLARDLARNVDYPSALHHPRALENARSLARDLNHAIDRALNLAIDRALNLVLNRVRDLGHADDLDRVLTLALDHDLGIAGHARDLDLFRHLDRARDDFTTADLRGVDLTRISLDGLRWSDATTWPSEDSKNQALLDSTEIGPGLYEIRRGTTNAPAHTS
jgi:hypothetical protein